MARRRTVKGKKTRRTRRGRKQAPKRRRRGAGRGWKLESPDMQDVKVAGAMIAADAVDDSVFELPGDLHPWAAATFAAALATKNRTLLHTAYQIELAHLSRRKGITGSIGAKLSEFFGKVGGGAGGGGAVGPGSQGNAPELSDGDVETVAAVVRGLFESAQA